MPLMNIAIGWTEPKRESMSLKIFKYFECLLVKSLAGPKRISEALFNYLWDYLYVTFYLLLIWPDIGSYKLVYRFMSGRPENDFCLAKK